MTTVDSAAARMLSPLSTMLRRPLALADAQSPEAGSAFSVRIAMPRIAVISADGNPFTEEERRIIRELLEVVRIAEESEARYRELEHRMMSLTRENLDLTVKNRLLSEVSSRDALTGLYNRAYVIEKLDSELNRSIRHGSPMALLLLDIDHFKKVNDTFGHNVGDEVLKSVGKLLRDSCRVYDVPGRYGGEEFCIVLPETKLGNTGVVAERIRQRLETADLCFGDATVSVTASIGIAGVESVAGEGALNPAALIDRADRALYSAKRAGRNRVELWSEEVSH